jgi:hypothetical protein
MVVRAFFALFLPQASHFAAPPAEPARRLVDKRSGSVWDGPGQTRPTNMGVAWNVVSGRHLNPAAPSPEGSTPQLHERTHGPNTESPPLDIHMTRVSHGHAHLIGYQGPCP